MGALGKSSTVSVRRPSLPEVVTAVVAVCWLALPFTLGDAVADAVADEPTPARWVTGVSLWVAWAVGAATVVIARTSSLTVARFVVTGAVPFAAVAIVGGNAASDPLALVGLTCASLAGTLVLTPAFGDRSVNGSSYGAERRFALRPPAAMVVLLPFLWAVVVTAVAAGPLLVLGGAVIIGAVVWVAGWPIAAVIVRRTHVLSRRWLVLVPAGVVVHDPWVLTDSLLVQRANLDHLGPASADTEATDLTAGAAGLAMEVGLRAPSSILTVADRRAAGGSFTAPGTEVSAVLVTPSRPGAVLRTLTERRLPMGHG